MELFFRIFGIITPVLVVSAIGFGYGRVINPDMRWINRLSTDVFFPALIFSAMASKDFHILEYLPLLVGSVALILGSGLLAWAVARLFHYNVAAFVPSMMFSNVANMGLPLTLFAFGPAMLPAAVSMFMLFSLIHFTLGIRMQHEFDLQRRRGGLPRMIVGRVADAAERKHHVAGGKAAPQAGGDACRIVA